MAGTTNDFQNGAPFYLDATQQDLLLAALASNNQNANDLFSTALDGGASDKQSLNNASTSILSTIWTLHTLHPHNSQCMRTASTTPV